MEKQTIFEIDEHEIEIMRPSWKKRARVTVRNDYRDNIIKYKWTLKNGYPYNSQLGYLHIYIMRKWYGDDIYDEMKNNNYVVDHMNNDHMDARICNLAFLNVNQNISKGHDFDIVNKEKMYIALSLFRDFDTRLFQVTINFNYPAKIIQPEITEPAILIVAYLLYEDDYSKVLYDCQQILNEYYKNYTISPQYLRCIDYDLEGSYEEQGSKEDYDYYMSGAHGHGICCFYSRGYIKGWDEKTKRERFYLHPPIKR